MTNSRPGVRVLRQNLSYGTLGMGGGLGHDSPMTNDRVFLPDVVGEYSDCLSAHAPSALFVELNRPMAIRGALNGSGWLHAGGECEFWIDHHWIGDVRYSGSPTPWIRLPPGQYLLRARTTKESYGAHTVWLLKEDTLPATDRLALTTIGCYPEDKIKHALRWLHTSAAQQGVLLHVFGVGEGLGTWFSAKVQRLRGWLSVLPSCYGQAIFMDGTDTMLLDGEETLRQSLLSFAEPTVIGAESCPWPEDAREWCEAFPADTPERFPQAGGWGGCLRGPGGLLDTLSAMEALRADWMAGKTWEWLLSFRHFNDDQFLWQAIWRVRPDTIARDTGSRLFANLTCTNTELASTDRLRIVDNHIVYSNQNRPSCVHFSGGGKARFGPWLAFLGVAR